MKKSLLLLLSIGLLAINGFAEQVKPTDDLQSAIDNNTDGIIELEAGEYVGGFVINGKTGLTISGVGDETIIKAPSAALPTDHQIGTNLALIAITNSSEIQIQNMKVDGNNTGTINVMGTGGLSGIGVQNSTGVTIDSLTVFNIRDESETMYGMQRGRAIVAYAQASDSTPNYLTIKNCNVYDFQKNGIDVRGAWDVTIKDNTITGPGDSTHIAANAIVVYDMNATDKIVKANITGNAISEFGYDYRNEWDNAASGILAYSDNKDCEMIISGNLITNANTGIHTDGKMTDVSIENNTITSKNEIGNWGIWCESLDANIAENLVENQSDNGIYVGYSGTIRDNKVYNCGTPIETQYAVVVSNNETVKPTPTPAPVETPIIQNVDTTAPVIEAVAVRNIRKNRYRVVYTVSDESTTSEYVSILNTVKKGQLKSKNTFYEKQNRVTEYSAAGKKFVVFKVVKKKDVKYKACVTSLDATGNLSNKKCVRF